MSVVVSMTCKYTEVRLCDINMENETKSSSEIYQVYSRE